MEHTLIPSGSQKEVILCPKCNSRKGFLLKPTDNTKKKYVFSCKKCGEVFIP